MKTMKWGFSAKEYDEAVMGANYMQEKSEITQLKWLQATRVQVELISKLHALPCKECYGIGQRQVFFPYEGEKGLMECPRCCGHGWVCVSCQGHEKSCECGNEE